MIILNPTPYEDEGKDDINADVTDRIASINLPTTV